MNRISAIAVGALSLMVATAASAQPQHPQTASGSQTLRAPTTPNPPAPEPESHPLFHIGNLPVVVWAPVQPPYSAAMNRNQAANPIWGNNQINTNF